MITDSPTTNLKTLPSHFALCTLPFAAMSASASLADVLERVATDPFELSTVSALENYVTYELREKVYDFEINKALLRCYQVNAEWIKLDFVVNIMVLSLMRLPSTDFLSLSYFLHGKLAQEPKLKQLQTFYDLLERAEFAKFWVEFKASDASVTSAAVGFADAIRAFILGATRDTFRNISKELLSQFLGLSTAELQAFLQSNPLVEQVSLNILSRYCAVIFCAIVFCVPRNESLLEYRHDGDHISLTVRFGT
jgi:hypothetical protein